MDLVTQWQENIQDEDSLSGSVTIARFSTLAEETSSLFLEVLVSGKTNDVDRDTYEALRKRFLEFYMWNEGLSSRSGNLDTIISLSQGLKATVMELMTRWVTTMLKVCKVFSGYDWSYTEAKVDELQEIVFRLDQVARSSEMDVTSDLFKDDDSNTIEESLPRFMFSTSSKRLDSILEDLDCYMENLVDLSCTLKHPAEDPVPIMEPGATHKDAFSSISEPARAFARNIKDKFDLIDDMRLVTKLGEANLKRHQRLLHTSSSARLGSDSDQPMSKKDNTTSSGQTKTSFVASTMFSASIAPSNQSVTSIALSGFDRGQRRIPGLPEDHDYSKPFNCQYCGEFQKNIKNGSSWRKHVYEDLQSYVCLFADCSLGVQTFQYRKDWVVHEFQSHRVQEEWSCGLCQKTFETQQTFRDHIMKLGNHNTELLAPSQIEEVIRTSRCLVPRDVAKEECPFCLTFPASTQKAFASHVGRHLQEISLAALPRLEADDDSCDEVHSKTNIKSDTSSIEYDAVERLSADNDNEDAKTKTGKVGEERHMNEPRAIATPDTKASAPKATASAGRTIPQPKPQASPNVTATVEKDVASAFTAFANQQRKNLENARARNWPNDKESKLNDLKRFAEDFRLPTPIPQDLVPIIAKDPEKQKELIEKSKRNSEY